MEFRCGIIEREKSKVIEPLAIPKKKLPSTFVSHRIHLSLLHPWTSFSRFTFASVLLFDLFPFVLLFIIPFYVTFIPSFIGLFRESFIDSFTRSFVYSFICSVNSSFYLLVFFSFIRLFIHRCPRLSIHSIVLCFWFFLSFVHSIIYSFHVPSSFLLVHSLTLVSFYSFFSSYSNLIGILLVLSRFILL